MISIVIPAYNEEKCLGTCLEALRLQDTGHTFEVIVVDNASADETSKVAQSFTNTLPIRVVQENRKGRGAARHAGCKAARGDIILTTDADSLVPPDWVEVMTKGFVDPSVIAITGTGYIDDCSALANWIFNRIQPLFTEVYRMVYGVYWVCGFNGGVRRDAYIQCGGYNSALNGQEDTQLALSLRPYGRIERVRASRVKVSGRRFKAGFWRGMFDYIYSFVSTFFLTRDGYLSDVR